MDPIGHALIGSAVLAMAPVEGSLAVGAAVLLGAEAPDADVVVKWAKGEAAYLKHHRGATHGPVGVLLLSAVIAWGVALATGQPFALLFTWALAGAFSHVLFDVTNNYGTQALWPFSRTRFALDWSPIIDVWLMLLITAGWLIYWFMPGSDRQVIFTWVWVGILAYYVGRGYLHTRAMKLVKARFPEASWQAGARPEDEAQRQTAQLSVHPCFLNVFGWRYVVQDKDQFLTGLVYVNRGAVTKPWVARHWSDAVVMSSLQSPLVALFKEFARHPRAEYQEKESGITEVRWTDMRFEIEGYSPFTAKAWIDKELHLLDDRLGPRDMPEKEFIRKRLQEERGKADEPS